MFSLKKLHINLRNHNCRYICRSCLSSYSSQNVSLKQKERCEQQKTTSIRNSNESHLYWKKTFFLKSIILYDYCRF